MSKMDALRAMREARYAEAEARAKQSPRARKAVPPVAPPVAPKPSRVGLERSVPEPETDAAEQLCGHRNMSGRTCTREAGHAAKSHRYS